MTRFLFVLFLITSSLSKAETATNCDSTLLQNIKKMIAPDLKLNGDFVLGLLTSSIDGKLKCEDISTRLEYDDLATCGYVYPSASHRLHVTGQNQSWNLIVEEVKVSCGGDGFWLQGITSEHGQIIASIVQEDQILSQIHSCGVETADDYRAIVFANGEDDGKKQITRIVNIDDQKTCAVKNSLNKIVTLSAATLGLSSQQTQSLNQPNKTEK